MYRILIIQGVRDIGSGAIDLDAEVNRLASLGERFDKIQVVMLDAGMAEIEIVDWLALNEQPFDAVHFLGHADDGRFYLTANATLLAPRMRSICRDAGARLAFINSCTSARIGQYLVNNGLAVAICYASGVFDRDAIINAIRFYAALSKSNDPFHDGIREGYTAADPGDGSLLWLTNGQYVAQIIKPIMDRLDQLTGTQQSMFGNFQGMLKKLENNLTGRVTGLTRQATHTRYALLAVLASVVVFTVVLAWAAAFFATSNAQAIRSLTPVPEPSIVGGSIPPRPATGTPWPSQPRPTSTATSQPRPISTSTSQPRPTSTATSQPRPTSTATSQPRPISTSTSKPTPDAFLAAVQTAVYQTVSVCGCEN